MNLRFFKWLNTTYPQNYLLRNPYKGALIWGLLTWGFSILYHPLTTSTSGRMFNYELTMGSYCLALVFLLIPLIKMLKIVPWFSSRREWTFEKELVAGVLILFVMCIYVFLIAFIIEAPGDRWNWPTFFDSCKNTFFIGMFPYLIFTVQGYKHLLAPVPKNMFNENMAAPIPEKTEDVSIQIKSQLKKDNLSFSPDAFLYAESDGNYVNFYLKDNGKICKKVIRNSITNIDKQLTEMPHFLRTHRAFIVNMNKVIQKKGNASGYRLTLEDIEVELPVSRQNVPLFDQMEEQLSV
ncbi:LytTR family transcriptional regulator [Marinilabiliaceae bacterium JC017]|nr:LytTR family transcriptional regulator [Marinilabiliaceae bacterium JC017]